MTMVKGLGPVESPRAMRRRFNWTVTFCWIFTNDDHNDLEGHGRVIIVGVEEGEKLKGTSSNYYRNKGGSEKCRFLLKNKENFIIFPK